jgi:hypothetical protein
MAHGEGRGEGRRAPIAAFLDRAPVAGALVTAECRFDSRRFVSVRKLPFLGLEGRMVVVMGHGIVRL